MMQSHLLRMAVPLAVVWFAVACSEERKVTQRRDAAPQAAPEATPEPGPVAGDAFPAAQATATVRGVVRWRGDLPRKRKIPIAGDPFCEKCYADTGPPVKEEYEIDEETRGVAHCFVKVVGAERRWKFDPPAEPAHLDQIDCRYVPHVLGLMPGQKLIVSSSDATQHNVHFVGRLNRLAKANFTQNKGQKDELVFKRPETAKFKCDIHSWMGAIVHIVPHPLFAVTDAKGRFELPKLPPGDYELEVVHEKWKGSKATVSVGDGETRTVEMTVGQ